MSKEALAVGAEAAGTAWGAGRTVWAALVGANGWDAEDASLFTPRRLVPQRAQDIALGAFVVLQVGHIVGACPETGEEADAGESNLSPQPKQNIASLAFSVPQVGHFLVAGIIYSFRWCVFEKIEMLLKIQYLCFIY